MWKKAGPETDWTTGRSWTDYGQTSDKRCQRPESSKRPVGQVLIETARVYAWLWNSSSAMLPMNRCSWVELHGTQTGLVPPEERRRSLIQDSGETGVSWTRKDWRAGSGRKDCSKAVRLMTRRSSSKSPIWRAAEYSSRRVVWNMAGSSVERVTGMP